METEKTQPGMSGPHEMPVSAARDFLVSNNDRKVRSCPECADDDNDDGDADLRSSLLWLSVSILPAPWVVDTLGG